MITKTSFLLSFVFCLNTQAAERFSVQEWKESFANALSSNNTARINQLKDIKTLEYRAIPSCVDCTSKKKMRQARDLFSKGQYAQAERLYNQIPKESDSWLEAVEEKGWAHFRNENYEKALAQTKTLLSPQFVGAVNTEAYFLQSLSQLRICDYEGILTTHQGFKEKHKSRLVEIQNLSRNGVNDALKAAIKKIDQFPLKYSDFGDLLTKLPLLFYRDVEVQKQLLRIKISQAALGTFSDTSTSQLRMDFLKLKDEASHKLQNRMKVLAQTETDENSKMIRKLNLIEVEAIQRIHTDMKLTESDYKKGKFKKVSEDQLIFMDDGQPWIDELDKYDVAAKACNKGIRRKM